MIRTFLTHEVRETKDLEGLWEFYTMDEDGEKACKYNLMVPGCWENHPELGRYRGKGVYRKKVILDKNANIRFLFQGVSHTAEVFFDGIKRKEHYNAYTAFEVLLPGIEKGEHVLEMIVDNSFTSQSSLHIPNDYYTYGGIIRPVVMEYIPDIFISGLQCIPHYEEGVWKISLEVQIENLLNIPVSVLGELCVAQTKVIMESADVLGTVKWKQDIDVPGVFPWSPQNPALYTIKMQLKDQAKVLDDLIDRVGFRVVTIEKERIFLNGEQIFFKGFNRHEDFPGSGCSLSFGEMNRDIDLILSSNANLIRTSHYPNDDRFIDLCDEKGIMVWEESHARGLTQEQMMHPDFRKQSLDGIEEMIESHRNHPSILIWGLLNECASDTEYGRICYTEQIQKIRELDQSRPVTFASDRHYKDSCFDLADIVSMNIYPGWYGEEEPGAMADSLKDWIQTTGGKDKPFLISEFGAGAIYGYRSLAREKWSEERQKDIIECCISQLMAKEYISGCIIWQFSDCRVTEEEWALKRPKSQNNKGIFDQYRRPKLAYETVKILFEQER